MKKLALRLLAIAVVVAAVIAGPALLDLYRLDRYIKSSAQAYEAERGPWPQVSDACTGCHGVNGNSLNQDYPSLAGQPSAYLSAQLRRFASGERVSPIMNAMARSLKDGDIDAVAGYFARQRVDDNRFFTADQGLLEKGGQIVGAGGCAACHGDGLKGRETYPRLAGLGYDYLLKQLDGFADGTRRDPGQAMNQLAAAWSPHERKAIAAFLSAGGR